MTNKDAIEFLKNMISQEGGRAIGASDFMLELCGYHVTALRMGIKALEYDDAKYHEEHGEVVVDKAVWEDAKKALEQEPCEDAISGKMEQMIHLAGREASKALQAGEYISKKKALYDMTKTLCDGIPCGECVFKKEGYCAVENWLKQLPTVAIPSAEPKKCKNCKWWRDSDGAYRRGIKAESRCPINTVSVANGWGYCYMFEPQERSDKE